MLKRNITKDNVIIRLVYQVRIVYLFDSLTILNWKSVRNTTLLRDKSKIVVGSDRVGNHIPSRLKNRKECLHFHLLFFLSTNYIIRKPARQYQIGITREYCGGRDPQKWTRLLIEPQRRVCNICWRTLTGRKFVEPSILQSSKYRK